MTSEIQKEELDIIYRTRGEVMSRKDLTGENLFLAWGYPTAIILFLEFLALIFLDKDWCMWLWLGIPLVGVPLMMYFLNEDYERTHHRTLEQNVILQMWVFIGFASGVAGTVLGFADYFSQFFCAFQGILLGLGCFMTGIILHYRPKIICGIIASALSIIPIFLQGELWPWQLLVTSLIAIISLIIPGHLFRRYVINYRTRNM